MLQQGLPLFGSFNPSGRDVPQGRKGINLDCPLARGLTHCYWFGWDQHNVNGVQGIVGTEPTLVADTGINYNIFGTGDFGLTAPDIDGQHENWDMGEEISGTPCSIATWFMPTFAKTWNKFPVLIGNLDSAVANGAALYYSAIGDKYRWVVARTGGASVVERAVSSDADMGRNVDNLFVCTADEIYGSFLAFNGVEASGDTTNKGAYIAAGVNTEIGHATPLTADASSRWIGRIYMVAVWNRFLDEQERYYLWNPATRWNLWARPHLLIAKSRVAAAAADNAASMLIGL